MPKQQDTTKRVITFGVWDLLHVGHVRFLERAKCLGTELTVGVCGDQLVYNDKRQFPVIPANQRVAMLAALRCVDHAVLYHRKNFVDLLRAHQPHVMAVGPNWGQPGQDGTAYKNAEDWMQRHNGTIVTIRRTRGVSSTRIRNQLGQ